ncbi:MAG: single-stranded-DNA-specific exonuclease RecJ [Gemmatimonadota bacterium]|nr:single-stranded-DNA-specific exonuclease RecJ [Gemmatimonadota bacterium]
MTAGVDSLTPHPTRWQSPAVVDREDVAALRGFTHLPIRLCELLVRRGLAAGPDAAAFLRPSLDGLHPPSSLPDLPAAADRIEHAIAGGEGILVHGDYDVDGMTGAAVLAGAIEELGGRVDAFVPHRTRDGYDLGGAGIARARRDGSTLIVTVDCGISAIGAVESARSHGIDVIVTDHHRPGPVLPSAAAVVDPAREGHDYPYGGLAGVGVAFKLVQELFARRRLEQERLNRYLDLVALGTVADQAPLTGENRVLVRFGLKVLDRTGRPGLRALMRVARVGEWSSVRASDIAFRLAPRLNSAGRIGEAEDGLRLLRTDDPVEADRLATEIEQINARRREADREIFADARAALDDTFDPVSDRLAVAWREGWHPGVLGIAASRLVDRIGRPAILVAVEGDRGRGSARSVPGFHLFDALSECADLFDRFGGHAAAAGFDIAAVRLPELRARLLEGAASRLPAEPHRPASLVDLELGLHELDAKFVRGFTHLEPFGNSNQVPLMAARGVRFDRIETVGAEGEHLRAALTAGGVSLEAISFGDGSLADGLRTSPVRDVVFELHVEERARGLRAQAHLVSISADAAP